MAEITQQVGASTVQTISKREHVMKRLKQSWQLYLILAIPVILVAVFSYGPMYGIQIAFKDYIATKGIWGSNFVGLKHFEAFVTSHQFPRLLWNTLTISFYSLAVGFPIPIILAIAINECKSVKFKKSVQMITYAPYFISTVVMVGIILMFLASPSGLVNQILGVFGIDAVDFMGKPGYFKSIYVWTGIWQTMGFNSIIYIAALSGVDPTLYEAATVDGASRWQKIVNVDIPSLLPTITILLIMNFGSIMSVGHEKILLMQNPLNMATSDVISTFVYRMGLENAQYSFSAAVGLFNSIINLILIMFVNKIAKKIGESSLW
ncbi:MAG: ABC transporter permease [Cellulosilyticaceae bacterium]